MPHHQPVPDLYRVLAVISAGVPIVSIVALEVAGLRPTIINPRDPRDPGFAPLSAAHRELFSELADRRGWIRWVKLASSESRNRNLP